MNIIMKYEVNGEVYCILKENETYRVAKFCNEKMDYELDVNELEFSRELVNKLLPSEDLRKVTSACINNKVYDIFYNRKKDLYWFDASGEDLVILNNVFNHRPSEMYDKILFNKPKDFFRRVVKVGSSLVVVLVASSFILGLNSGIINDIDDSINLKKHNTYYETRVEDMYTVAVKSLANSNSGDVFSLIEECVNKNGMLNAVEKKEILKVPFLFEDNSEYLIMDEVLCHFDRLLVVYDMNENIDLNATFNHTLFSDGRCDAYIKLYGASNVYDNLSGFEHEVCHALQSGIDSDLNYNYMLVEATNTMFTNEYFGADESNPYDYDVNAYYDEVKLTKALAEIIGSDALKKYHAYIDEEIIIDALVDILPNRDMAQSLLTMLNTYGLYVSNVIPHQDYLTTSVRDDIVSMLSIYYEEKYHRNMDDDLIMMYYTKTNEFYEILQNEYGMNDFFVLQDKCYINSILKKTKSYLKFGDGEIFVKIDDNNRMVNKSCVR